MDMLGAALLGLISASLLVLAAAIGILIAALWLGMRVIAPRLQRALDRADTENEQDRDRYD